MASGVKKVGFDYGEFDADTRGKLISIAGSIGRHRRAAAGELMAIANEVAKAHGVLAAKGCEGRFTGWVEAECHMSRATAYRLIDIDATFGGFPDVANIEDSALRRLADSATPEDVVNSAKRAAKSGTFVDVDWVKDRVDQWKAKNVDDDEDDDEPATYEIDDDDTDVDDDEDATDSEDEDADTEVSGGREVGSTRVAGVSMKMLEDAARKMVAAIDEISAQAGIGGDQRNRAMDLLTKLCNEVRSWS